MRKKTTAFFALLLAFAMVISLGACSQETPAPEETKPAETTPAPAEEEKTDEFDPSQYLIGFSQGWNGVEFTQKMRKGVEDTCKEFGLELVSTDANDSGEKQVADIEDLITRGVDVLLVATYKPEAIANACQNAIDAGIPVIVMSTAVKDVEGAILLTTDAVKMGEDCAKYLIEKIGGKGEIIQLTGKEGSTVNRDRTAGFQNILKEYPDVKLVASVACDYDRTKSLNATEDLLKVHPNIVGIYCNNDDMALGAMQAVEDAGKKVAVDGSGVVIVSVGDGINEEVLDMVEAGKMYSQRNSTYGRDGVLTAIQLLKGEKFDNKVVLDAGGITQENVASFREK